MLRKKKKHYAIGLFASLVIGVSLLMGPTAYATETDGSTETEVELTTVDTSKGITYIYDDSNNVQGINLNGNSVIIEASKNGNTNQYNNFYIDKDRDGVLDEDEKTLVTVGDSTDVIAGQSIYGVYQQKTTTRFLSR